MTKKITELTQAQIDAMPRYYEEGLKIGLATGPDMDEALVRELTDKHREICGVPKAVNFTVYDSPFAAMKANEELTVHNALYGQHDINWLMFYTFFRVECGLIEETAKTVYLMELAKRVNWMWMSSTDTIVTRRPAEIHLMPKANGISVLHNENGMALRYIDGTGVYALNGVRIPKSYAKFINHKENIDFAEVINIPNTEVRSEIIKMLGPEAMFKCLPSKQLDFDTIENGGDYELLEVEVNGQRRVYLTGECPSKGDRWFEAVHPDCTTVKSALNWREWAFIGTDNYLPPVIRT